MPELITNTKNHCLKLQSDGITRYTTILEIVYLKSEGNYTIIILNDLSQYTMRKTLLNFETVLGRLFLRCHRTFLVNPVFIKEINTRHHQILLTTGETIPYSRNKARILDEKMIIKTALTY